ncbi:MAG TPA: hypothetical protein VNV41_05570 [Candidatus Acidoferrales bacterium]|jgi:hypothetical protein|nr:hypothetical protein [Candidatus Acidoferrales bacterium]
MYVLDIEPLDLGADVRSVGLDLVEADENREPVRGADAARIWSRVLQATAGQEAWALDFFSHIDRVRDFCKLHEIAYRETNQRSIVIPAPEPAALESLLERFEAETFGARAGALVATGAAGDPALEADLARRGVDAYRPTFTNYFFCGVCAFEDASLVLLSEKLWASEVIRRVRPAIHGLDVEVRLPN